jgi:hypothetical protein
MGTARRAAILNMATSAYEMDLEVANGIISLDANGRWLIGEHDLALWLKDHLEEEMVIILGSLEDDRPVATRSCKTCGRDFTDLECPHCRASRLRLRGEP